MRGTFTSLSYSAILLPHNMAYDLWAAADRLEGMEAWNVVISIFNDVVGPVMRGPSSSHCAAALRIGRLARELMDGDLREIRVEYDKNGSLATTHESHGSDMGLFAGLMGWTATDERLPRSLALIRESGVRVTISIRELSDPHPNTYNLSLANDREQHTLTALSTGGGMLEVIAVDGFSLSMEGDYYETLIRLGSKDPAIQNRLVEAGLEVDHVFCLEAEAGSLLEIKGQRFLEDQEIALLGQAGEVQYVKRLAPVLPVLSRRGMRVPFTCCEEMLAYDAGRNLSLSELAILYEAERSGLTGEEVVARMGSIVRTLQSSIEQGIAGTEYENRILGHQSGEFLARLQGGRLLDGGLLNRMVLQVTALMEVKSAMGVIVAAPTAGSCGAFPGACLAAAEALALSEEDAARAMLAGGLIGVFIAGKSTFAAELAGCQAECGSGSGMAAAALVSLAKGTTQQALAAASMALQNSLGLPCDPVANRVEVPCLGKNVMAAGNALACANMALADFDPVVPLDQVIESMDRVGRSLPRALRCTSLGGLSITDTSKEIEKRLGQAGDSGSFDNRSE